MLNSSELRHVLGYDGEVLRFQSVSSVNNKKVNTISLVWGSKVQNDNAFALGPSLDASFHQIKDKLHTKKTEQKTNLVMIQWIDAQ